MSETAIAAAPIVSALSPFINAAASGLVIGVGGLLFRRPRPLDRDRVHAGRSG